VHAPHPGRYSEDLDFVVPQSPQRWKCDRILRDMQLDLNLSDFQSVSPKTGPFMGLYMNYLDLEGRSRTLKWRSRPGL